MDKVQRAAVVVAVVQNS